MKDLLRPAARLPRCPLLYASLLALAWTGAAQGQTASDTKALSAVPVGGQAVASDTAAQTASIFGLSDLVETLRRLRAARGAGTTPTIEERLSRLELMEGIETATLKIDSVVAEISNERNQLGDLRTSLEARRDKTVGHLTTAALLTGSGVGTIVNATQITTLSSTVQNTGDGLGIGSGIVSTLLSIEAARKQAGPSAPVGETPNMLAPLLGGKAVLNTSYAPEVLTYLQTTPSGEDPGRGTRLDQLKQRWVATGRLQGGTADAKAKQKLDAATVSEDPSVKLSIEDLTNRIAMLGDVQGRVSLIKRDLATLMVEVHPATAK